MFAPQSLGYFARAQSFKRHGLNAGMLCAAVSTIGAFAPAANAQTYSLTTATTGTSFIVPTGVTQIQMELWGAGGGGGTGLNSGHGGNGGGGAFVSGTFSVTTGETLILLVGGAGTAGGAGLDSGGAAASAGGGGGYSAIYAGSINTANLLLVAGGGGGGGYGIVATGGAGAPGGGTAAGGSGTSGGTGGESGTTTYGAGGTGALGNGINGASLTGGGSADGAGGGGGGGFFGGGSGGSVSTSSGGGGGGSSYTNTASGTVLISLAGLNTFAGGNTNVDYVVGAGIGGIGTTSGSVPSVITSHVAGGTTGGDGEVFLRYSVTSATNSPEPGTLSLLGLALIAPTAAIRLRRRKTPDRRGGLMSA